MKCETDLGSVCLGEIEDGCPAEYSDDQYCDGKKNWHVSFQELTSIPCGMESIFDLAIIDPLQPHIPLR